MLPCRSRRVWLFIVVVAFSQLVLFATKPMRAAEGAVSIPPPTNDVQTDLPEQAVVLSGGCFWGVQGVFQHTLGITDAVSGYAGGSKDTANYFAVSHYATGHAESVKVTYDPKKITYGKILQIFFSVVHDPTQLNRQGPDSGTQYRSAIFTTTLEQKNDADACIRQLEALNIYKKPIVTKVGPLEVFYPAESYHQDYLTLNPKDSYIAAYDIPKLENLRKLFAEHYVETPTLVNRATARPSN